MKISGVIDASSYQVSILYIENEGSFERVNGTALGGGTLLGLCRLLTKWVHFNVILSINL